LHWKTEPRRGVGVWQCLDPRLERLEERREKRREEERREEAKTEVIHLCVSKNCADVPSYAFYSDVPVL
jgi:hypothetical protein